MQANRLRGTLPPSWGQLSNLEVLFLDYNLLSGTIPAEWSGMTSMELLQLKRNVGARRLLRSR